MSTFVVAGTFRNIEMPSIYALIALGCMLGADCEGDFHGGMEVWPQDKTEARLQNGVYMNAEGSMRWRFFKLRGSGDFYLWQQQADRPCGDMSNDNPLCFGGIFHVEIDEIIERRQSAQILLTRRGVDVGVSLNRWSVHWPEYKGEKGWWPVNGGNCQSSDCYIKEPSRWRGMGHSDTWGIYVGISGDDWNVRGRRVMGLITSNVSLPFARYELSGEIEKDPYRIEVTSLIGNRKSLEVKAGRSFGYVHTGLIAGRMMYPGADPNFWNLGIRIGVEI